VSALVIRRPDDWHLHLRDGAALAAVLPFTAARFARAIVMPNLNPPVTTTAAALAYRERIRAAVPAGAQFEPLMTLYLTDRTPVEEIARARSTGGVLGCKLYPAGATTHSAAGVTDVRRLDAVFERMAEAGLVLQVHGEVTDPAVDVFEREPRFIDTVLAPLAERHPRLRIVFEHITTRAAVEFVLGAREGIAATLTPQHLLMNRNALFAGGLRPHHYCAPVLKAEGERLALLDAVVRGSPRLFLGTDSAPYAEVFAAAGALERLEAFASIHGADFYGLPRNGGTLTLVPEPWEVPASYPFGTEELVPLRAGERIAWRLASHE